MREYKSPSVELITFSDDMVMVTSNCNCRYDGYDEVVTPGAPGYDEECGAASWHASENPWNIPAPEYGQGL